MLKTHIIYAGYHEEKHQHFSLKQTKAKKKQKQQHKMLFLMSCRKFGKLKHENMLRFNQNFDSLVSLHQHDEKLTEISFRKNRKILLHTVFVCVCWKKFHRRIQQVFNSGHSVFFCYEDYDCCNSNRSLLHYMYSNSVYLLRFSLCVSFFFLCCCYNSLLFFKISNEYHLQYKFI